MAIVLIVEDNEDNRDIYRTILVHEGHTVLLAVNGAEGVRMARDRLPDVIIMDVTMPVMGGLEATRRIKADPLTSGIPVLILTAHTFADDVANAVAAGADAYLPKPCAPTIVLAEVARLAR